MKYLVLVILLFNYSSIYSCVCDYSLTDDFKETPLILIVEIEKSFDGERAEEDLFGTKEEVEARAKIWGYHVQAKVLKIYKGSLKFETIEIKGDMFFSCAEEFKIGSKYLVFLYKSKKRKQFLTSVCHHNTNLNNTDSFFEDPKKYFNEN